MQFEATKAVCYLDHLTHHTFPETKVALSKNVHNFWHQFFGAQFMPFHIAFLAEVFCINIRICRWCGLPRVLSDLSQNWLSRCSHCCCCHHCHHCHHCFCPGHRHHENCYHIHRHQHGHHHNHNCSSHLFLSIKSTQSDRQLREFVILPAGAISWPQKWTWNRFTNQVWFST